MAASDRKSFDLTPVGDLILKDNWDTGAAELLRRRDRRVETLVLRYSRSCFAPSAGPKT